MSLSFVTIVARFFFFTSIIFGGGGTIIQTCLGHPFGQQWPCEEPNKDLIQKSEYCYLSPFGTKIKHFLINIFVINISL